MNQKVLVAYASKAGSTAEVAQVIAQELTKRGYMVDLRQAKEVSDLSDYQAVVLGSAVRFSQWLPDALKFVEQNRATLVQMPTAFFAVHLLNAGSDETSRKMRLACLDSARKLVVPTAEAFFMGVGDPKKVSFIEGLIGKMVKSPEGDFRDWDAIRSWAAQLPL